MSNATHPRFEAAGALGTQPPAGQTCVTTSFPVAAFAITDPARCRARHVTEALGVSRWLAQHVQHWAALTILGDLVGANIQGTRTPLSTRARNAPSTSTAGTSTAGTSTARTSTARTSTAPFSAYAGIIPYLVPVRPITTCAPARQRHHSYTHQEKSKHTD